MREPGIGRVLVASLHQAISEVLPTRIVFYESFLPAEGLRAGTIGIAPLSAVLSFLRQEGDAYDQATTRAGEYAADWTVQSMPPWERAMIGAAPTWLRARLALRLARRLVRNSCEHSRANSRLRGGMARIQLRQSVFCTVREPFHQPLCRFYAAAFSRLFVLFGLRAVAEVEACRGTGATASPCILRLSVSCPTEESLVVEGAS
jgi:hypothetical protein